MHSSRRILVVFQLPSVLRDVLEGISDYVKQADRKWQIECADAHDFHIAVRMKLVDGVITGLGHRSRGVITRLLRAKLPVVNTVRDLSPTFPSVLSDNHAIGKVGGSYLYQKGLRHFAFVGVDTPWSRERQAGFIDTLKRAGAAPVNTIHLGIADFEYASKVRAVGILRRWVRTLPRNTAVMCAADFISRTLLEVCEAERLLVPEHLAILGVDNFHAVCDIAPVPLSSVAQDFVSMGRRSAAILDQLLQHPAAPVPRRELVPPGRVFVRKSTDIFAFEDAAVVSALQMIHQGAATGVSMKELCQRIPLSRKWLDVRFKKLVGHTPSTEIRRCRLQHVRDLLIDTETPLRLIAARCRFSCVQNLSRSFRIAYGISPQAFRLRSRHISRLPLINAEALLTAHAGAAAVAQPRLAPKQSARRR